MENVKQRTLEELRQEKEFGYKAPVSHSKRVKTNTNEVYTTIQELAKQNPNDYDFGRKVRSYLIELGLYE